MEPLPPYPEIPRVIQGEKPSRLFMWLGIVAGVLVVAVVVGGFFAFRLIGSAFPIEPLEEASPISEECHSGCVSEADALDLAPGPDALAALGGAALMADDEPGFRQTVGDVDSTASFQYTSGEGEPFGCSFALAGGAVTTASSAMSVSLEEPIIGLGSYGDDDSFVTQNVRVFRDEAAADAYPAGLRDSLLHCPHYSVELEGVGQWTTDVTQVQFDVAHLAVDVVAWRESSGGYEYTVADLQYGNLAVRSMFSTQPGGAITDSEFAAFVLETSQALYALNPIEQIAAEPCSGACLTVADALTLTPASKDLSALGATGAVGDSTSSEPKPLGEYADDAHGDYYLGDGDPLGCEFVLSSAPLTTTNPGIYTRNDLVVDLGAYGTDASLTQSVQVFESIVWTDRYLASVESGVERCEHVDVNLVDLGHYVADLDPQNYPTSSPNVTTAGWVETSDQLRQTVVDLRYANLVLRTVFTDPDGGAEFTEEQIAAFVLATSERLEALG